MILLVDIGNSRTKYATVVDGKIEPGKVLENSKSFNALFETIAKPTAVYVCCVGSDALYEAFSNWVSQQWSCQAIRLHTQQRFGKVLNGYIDYERFGVDRWAALVGAYHMIKGAALVIDCGTACTADLINRDGQHCGGAIMPGRNLLQQSLRTGTVAIYEEPLKGKGVNWGSDTTGCIELGTESALLGFIDKMVQLAEKTLSQPFEIVLTGGDAATLRDKLAFDVRYEKELVFYGMAAMVEERG